MERITNKYLVRELVKFYAQGVEFYSDTSWNIDPNERKALFLKCLLEWNHWQGELNGNPS